VLASGDLPHIVQKNNVQLHAPQPISCSYTPSHLLSFTALSRPSSHERAARRNPGPSGPGQASYLSICGKEVAAPYQSGETPPFQGGVLQFLEPLPEPNGHYTPHNLPRGAETGVAIHQLFETLFAEKKPIEQIVEEQLFGSLLYPWKEVVVDMIHSTLHLLLPQGFSLVDVSEQKILIEREFLFGQQSDYIKGFIDLVFQQGGKLYFVDWKTNWLGDCSESYTTAAIQAAMVEHEYDLQAKLYTQAIQKAWEDRSDQPFQEVFGGAIYLFVRAPAAYCFNPLEDK
jgi:ATP-dependent exoDNAse (exonuclease V) beta subunit